MQGKAISWEVKKTFYQQVIFATVSYGAETWGLRETERPLLNIFEMKCLRAMMGVTKGTGQERSKQLLWKVTRGEAGQGLVGKRG